jgi:hypothetical protein
MGTLVSSAIAWFKSSTRRADNRNPGHRLAFCRFIAVPGDWKCGIVRELRTHRPKLARRHVSILMAKMCRPRLLTDRKRRNLNLDNELKNNTFLRFLMLAT